MSTPDLFEATVASRKWASPLRKRLFYQYTYGECGWPFDDPCDDWYSFQPQEEVLHGIPKK